MKILIADDEVHIRKILGYALTGAGYDVVSAQNGEEAINIMEKETVDLVITDLSMPKMNGYELTAKLKQNEKTKNIPVIVLTAIGQDDELQMAKEAGADKVLSKPFSPKKMAEIVGEMLK
ncbi:MAG: response regulator [Nitrospirota bacterium]